MIEGKGMADTEKRFSGYQLDSERPNETCPMWSEAKDKTFAGDADTDKKTAIDVQDTSDSPEKKKPIQNKIDGLRREEEVQADLKKEYPEAEGFEIVSEAYLRDSNGNIVKDSVTGAARRIDFVVCKNGVVVDAVEVTSQTADKKEQIEKENRIKENGGCYIRDNNNNLIKIPNTVPTRIERRD